MKNIITSLLLVFTISTFAQTGIGTTTPNTNAQLEVAATNKGFLPPRVALTSTTSASPLAAHVEGMVVYNTATVNDVTPGLYVNNGSAWTSATSSGGGGTKYNVGDFAQGGIVFWIDETGEHGLVCPKTDQNGGTVIRWYANAYGSTRAHGDGPYAGEANTVIIIAATVSIGDDAYTYAARFCNELQITEGGKTYADWYLPSKQELNLMYQNQLIINATATANGGSNFLGSSYWSSTEDSFNSTVNAWYQFFGSGNQNAGGKNTSKTVRAVRAF